MTKDLILRWIEEYGRDVEANKDVLTQFDAPIGDSDHGANMARGFRAVLETLPQEREKPIDAILKAVGMTLIRTVGGAAGPLYGTVFLRMAQATAGKETLSLDDVGAMLIAGQRGIVDRGKAEPGDKTMLDTWVAATGAYAEAEQAGQPESDRGQDLTDALRRAADAAEKGMQGTIPLVARKGRASYLGERSAGHQDAGATSSYLLFRDLFHAVSGIDEPVKLTP